MSRFQYQNQYMQNMSRPDDEDIFLTQKTFSQNENENDTELCNFFLGFNATNTSVVYSDISEDESNSNLNSKLTQSDEELLTDVTTLESETQKPSTSRFHQPRTDKEIEVMQKKKFADSTMNKIKWATSLFSQWKSNRNLQAADPKSGLSPIFVKLEDMSVDELNYCISRFICEVRKTDGKEYPPETLYSLVICLQLHMETRGFNHKFLMDTRFSQVKHSLDNIMKQRAEVRAPKKQAEEITVEDEEKLWASGALGSDNPRQLLNTLVYMIGLNFALRGGQEHRDLKAGQTSQFSVSVKNDTKCLIYNETKSKANQGGLKHRNVKQKSVIAYENIDNPNRCIVKVFACYLSHCPPFPRKTDALNLWPLKSQNGNIWFADQPIGRHCLARVVSEICKEASLSGYRTNHSLRASAATRMFDAGVDEQLICEVTGHRSNAVRSYKRTNDNQKRKINAVIQGRTESEPVEPSFKISKSEGNVSITLNISMK